MARVVHFEFTTPEPEKEADFFSSVLGWKMQRWGEEQYWLVDTGAGIGINGALMAMDSPEQPRTINTLEVDDVDGLVEKAIAAGATVAMPAQDMENVGRVAYLLSPTGILFGMIQSAPAEE